jgi:hypothetical protein
VTVREKLKISHNPHVGIDDRELKHQSGEVSNSIIVIQSVTKFSPVRVYNTDKSQGEDEHTSRLVELSNRIQKKTFTAVIIAVVIFMYYIQRETSFTMYIWRTR